MKLGLSSSGKEINAFMEPRFGRCPYLVLIDSETFSLDGRAGRKNRPGC
jgi:predicted Fe-Mo cluster-binding NifX family protein